MKIEIDKDFLKVLLGDEFELWTLSHHHDDLESITKCQQNIDEIKRLLKKEVKNKKVKICMYCKEHYCMECSVHDGLDDFCCDECEQEYNIQLLDYGF